MTRTLYLVTAMRLPTFDPAAVGPHRRFLDALQAEGRLLLTGGFADGSGGAYILCNVEDLEQARAIVATDPLVTTASSELHVHEWLTR
ncbi:YciI family protein [Luteimonas abyssi]|uniref:YciI family protein n=1 Tax=Luteimonas abyssi TaxID=1247514 RepID=UPI000A93093B|nr:YciI family protein [Luteimonas abyssi]